MKGKQEGFFLEIMFPEAPWDGQKSQHGASLKKGRQGFDYAAEVALLAFFNLSLNVIKVCQEIVSSSKLRRVDV